MDSMTRIRHTAEYQYPGALFPETVTRLINDPTFEAAVEAQPSEDSGWFGPDKWYAVVIRTHHESAFAQVGVEMNPDSTEDDYHWVADGEPQRLSYIVGTEIHVDDIPVAARLRVHVQSILKSNIRGNSREPKKDIGVLTRVGNWQIASDWDEVRAP